MTVQRVLAGADLHNYHKAVVAAIEALESFRTPSSMSWEQRQRLADKLTKAHVKAKSAETTMQVPAEEKS